MMLDTLRFPKITITGGAGYVGSALIPDLINRGYEVTVVDLFMYGEDVFGDAQNSERLKLVRADIRDQDRLSQAFANQDAVIHLACVSNDPSFELDPELGTSINYDAFFGLLNAVKEKDVKRLIYASSSSVYGVKDETNVREESSCEPLTDYSKYKLQCEEVLSRTDLGETEYVILRPATVCGYATRLRLDVIVNILTINALARKNIKVFGGAQLRPNLNIKDMVRVYATALEASSDLISGEVFNAGYENRSVADLATMVHEEVGDPDVTITVEPTDDLRSYHINSDKIERVLGFAPQYSIREAVQSICKAYRSGLIDEALTDSRFYNIRRMQEVQLSSSSFAGNLT